MLIEHNCAKYQDLLRLHWPHFPHSHTDYRRTYSKAASEDKENKRKIYVMVMRVGEGVRAPNSAIATFNLLAELASAICFQFSSVECLIISG